MTMDSATRDKILAVIVKKVEMKLTQSSKKPEHSPFFKPLFTQARMRQSTVLHSFYTAFGSVYEEIARILAERAGYYVKKQYHLAGAIDTGTEGKIGDLMKKPATKASDIEEIRLHVVAAPDVANDPDKVVDVYMERDGVEMLFDITTVKPSKKEFNALRLKMLRWCALRFSTNRDAKIETYIGIPFNPDYPGIYKRWTAKYLDNSEVLVQNDLWAKFAGYDVFPELEDIFNDAGKLLGGKILTYLDKL